MDVTILNTNLDAVSIVDTYESFIWTDRYYAYGDFELYEAMRDGLLDYINISFMITAHLSRDAEFHNRENDLKSISTNTTNYTEMTVIFYSVTFQSSMTILSMRLPNENC